MTIGKNVLENKARPELDASCPPDVRAIIQVQVGQRCVWLVLPVRGVAVQEYAG